MKIVFVLLCVFILSVYASCEPNYAKWLLKEGGWSYINDGEIKSMPRYSFEYPIDFPERVALSSIRPPWVITLMKKLESMEDFEESKSWDESILMILVVSAGSDELPPLETLFPEDDTKTKNLLSTTRVFIDNISKIRYLGINGLVDGDQHRIAIDTNFEYRGYTWFLRMNTPIEKSEIMLEYYHHMLQTFKFLE